MPLIYTPTQRLLDPPPPIDPTDLAGEDIALVRGELTLTPSGDWQTSTAVLAAKQSIEREASANPGSFARRPDWGLGLPASIFKSSTTTLRDELTSRARRRIRLNPRVTRLVNVTISPLTSAQGLTLDVSCEVGGRDARVNTVIKAGE
jgi:phage baseplate assembly protein W